MKKSASLMKKRNNGNNNNKNESSELTTYRGGKPKSKKVKDRRLGKYKHKDHTHKTKEAMKKCKR